METGDIMLMGPDVFPANAGLHGRWAESPTGFGWWCRVLGSVHRRRGDRIKVAYLDLTEKGLWDEFPASELEDTLAYQRL